MAYEPRVRTSGYRSASPVYSGRGARTSRHALNIFNSLDKENYARVHRGIAPSPFRDATLPTFRTATPSGSIGTGLQGASIDQSLGNLEKFGGERSYVSETEASVIVDSIAEAWSDRKEVSPGFRKQASPNMESGDGFRILPVGSIFNP